MIIKKRYYIEVFKTTVPIINMSCLGLLVEASIVFNGNFRFLASFCVCVLGGGKAVFNIARS